MKIYHCQLCHQRGQNNARSICPSCCKRAEALESFARQARAMKPEWRLLGTTELLVEVYYELLQKRLDSLG